jgi:hypothetical protein
MPRTRRPYIFVLGFAALLAASAGAHDRKQAGAVTLVIGWGDEPAFSGSRNSVDVDVADARGAAVADPGASLSVDVVFGSERISLPLAAAPDRPGRYRAWLVPTRAGTYTFHVAGTIRGQAIDVTTTCSDTTFACVADVSDVQFPAKDPSAGQLADRISRALPRADRAIEDAAAARTIGLTAIGVAALALAASIGIGVRRGGRGSSSPRFDKSA